MMMWTVLPHRPLLRQMRDEPKVSPTRESPPRGQGSLSQNLSKFDTFEVSKPCRRSAPTSRPFVDETKPRATKSWLCGACMHSIAERIYFGCSFNAAELMQ